MNEALLAPSSKHKCVLALLPVTFGADACITVHCISAVGSVFTLVILAVIKVNVTVFAYVSWRAVTSV